MSPFVSIVESQKLDIVRVAVYARQSKARPDASEASPEAQIAAGEALAASRNWEVTLRYKDVGRSGWDPKVIRPEFEEMMAAVERGEVDVVVINELSRLTRKGAYDAMTIDQKLKKHGVRLVSVLEPFLDTSNPVGEAIFALIAALAKQDSDVKAGRITGAKDEIRAVGGRHSSSPPYGMRAVRTQIGKLVVTTLEPDPDLAPNVLRLVELAEAGKSFQSIANVMESEEVTAPGALPQRATEARQKAIAARRTDKTAPDRVVWRAQTVRGILTHPTIGGFAAERVPRGPKGTLVNVVARDEAGEPMTPHTGVIPGPRWLALQAKLKTRGRSDRQGGGRSTDRLLSGWKFLTCGICDGSMGQSKNNGGQDYYMGANCNGHGISIKRLDADDIVARAVWARLLHADLSDPLDRDFVGAAAARFAAQQDVDGVEDERRETEAHLAHVKASIRELQGDRGLYRGAEELATWRATLLTYRAYEDTCMAKLEDMERELDKGVTIPTEWLGDDLMGDPVGPGSMWASWDVYEQRAFLALFLDGVSIERGRRADRTLIPTRDRVALSWRPAPVVIPRLVSV